VVEILTYSDEYRDSLVKLWQQTFPNSPLRNKLNAIINSKLAIQPELFFIAVQDNEVIGTAMSGYDGHRGWVYFVAVKLEYRRKGIGTALMKRAEESLIKLDCPKINLQIRMDNMDVVKFYESIGYKTEERVSMGKRLMED